MTKCQISYMFMRLIVLQLKPSQQCYKVSFHLGLIDVRILEIHSSVWISTLTSCFLHLICAPHSARSVFQNRISSNCESRTSKSQINVKAGNIDTFPRSLVSVSVCHQSHLGDLSPLLPRVIITLRLVSNRTFVISEAANSEHPVC